MKSRGFLIYAIQQQTHLKKQAILGKGNIESESKQEAMPSKGKFRIRVKTGSDEARRLQRRGIEPQNSFGKLGKKSNSTNKY